MTTYYTKTFDVTPGSRVGSQAIEDQFTLVQTGFATVNTEMVAKGAIAGQAWTGVHTFPTQTQGDNSTKAATTAYADAIKSYGTTTYAPLASPALTGTPTTPTASGTTNTTQIASTAMVQAALTTYAGTNLGLPTFTAPDALKLLRLNSSGNGYEWTASPTFTGYTETVYALSGTTPAFSEANGSIQTWTLSAASTPTDSLTTGQSIILVITPGAYSITWPSVTWTKQGGSGALPTLFTAGKTTVILWKLGSVLYGSHLGDM